MTRASRRTVTSFLPWVLLLAVVAGFAWLTWHPQSRILDWPARWPPAAPVVQAFRDRYSPRPAAGEAADAAQSPEFIVHREYEVVVPRPIDALPRVWIPAGEAIRERPESNATIVHRQQKTAGIPFRERRGDWFHVRTPVYEGWVYLQGYDEVSNPPLGSGQRAPLPLPSRPPAPSRLEAGLDSFSSSPRELKWDQYLVYTDLADGPLLLACRQAAQRIEAGYRRRYDLQIEGPAREVVLLFSRRQDYESFQEQDARVAGLPVTGHSGSGLVAMHADDQSPGEVVSTLVHELAHLLNRRALGPALPPWLEEGIADDLGLSLRDEQGNVRFDTFNGWRRQRSDATELGGGEAALEMTRGQARNGKLVSLQRLLSLDWNEFVRSTDRQRHYAQAFLFVRYLMAASGRRDGFIAYLHSIAEGEDVGAEGLRRRLGLSWSDLQREYVAWLLGPEISASRRDFS